MGYHLNGKRTRAESHQVLQEKRDRVRQIGRHRQCRHFGTANLRKQMTAKKERN